MSKRLQKFILAIGIIAYLGITGFVMVGLIERVIVKQGAATILYKIQQGVDDETLDQVVRIVLSETTDESSLGTFLLSHISGEDINDIYHVLIGKMEYDVTAVEKKERGHYRIGVKIENNNNLKVGQRAFEFFKQRYEGGLIEKINQLKEDVRADKSQLFATLFEEASDSLENNVRFEQEYVVDIELKDGEIVPYFENENGLVSFLSVCAGIPVSTSSTPEISDQVLPYSITLAVLLLIVIVSGVFYHCRVKAAGYNKTEKQKTPKGLNQELAETPIPVLYVNSPFHNNVPFAIHPGIPLLTGRDRSSCKVCFDERAAGVSNIHCSVSFAEDRKDFILVDLRSTYGTYIHDGQRLIPNKEYRLKPGMVFYAGDRTNEFKVDLLQRPSVISE